MKANLLIQLASFLLAILAIFTVPLLCDTYLGTPFTIFGIVWLNLGVACMRLKKINFPLPRKNKLDPAGAIKTIWWALFWPNYLTKKVR